MINEPYRVHCELPDGEQIELTYNHQAAWRLERGFIIGPEHGLEGAPITILEVERRPDSNGPGTLKARRFNPGHVQPLPPEKSLGGPEAELLPPQRRFDLPPASFRGK